MHTPISLTTPIRAMLSSIFVGLFSVGCSRSPQPPRSPFQPQPRSLAVVVDTSASMRSSDENRLAILATRIFSDLINERDNLTVITFPSGKEIIKPQGGLIKPVEFTSWISQSQDIICGDIVSNCTHLGEQIEGIAYDARFTVFQEPLIKATMATTQSRNLGNRAVVFLTDGVTDRWDRGTPDPEQHANELHTLNARIPLLVKNRVRFFGITFHQADRTQFKAMADRTGGHTAHVESPADLTREFVKVVSRILETQVETLRLEEDTTADLAIKPFVREVSLLFVGQSGDLSFEALEPRSSWWRLWEERRHFTSVNPNTASNSCAATGLCVVRRQSGTTPYTIVKLKTPRAGIWKIRVNHEASPLIIQDLDLHLDVSGGEPPREGWMGETNAFPARLVTSHGEVVTDPDFISDIHFSLKVINNNGSLRHETNARPAPSGQAPLSFVPSTEDPVSIRVKATNGDWLTRRLTIPFQAVKDIRLVQASVPQLPVHTPYTDPFLETLAGLIPESWGLWTPGQRRTCTRVSFAGSAPQARSVRFHFDNGAMEEKSGLRLVNPDGEPWFSLDADDHATVCLQAQRSTVGGTFEPLQVPVRSSSGREISGTRAIALHAKVERLPIYLRVFPLWLLFEVWLGWRLLMLLAFWWFRLFSPATTVEFRGSDTDHPRRARTRRSRRGQNMAHFHPFQWLLGTTRTRSRALAWLAFFIFAPLQALLLAVVCPLRTLFNPTIPVGSQPCHSQMARTPASRRRRAKTQAADTKTPGQSLPRRLMLTLADYIFGLNLSGQSWTIRHENMQTTWLITGVLVSRRIRVRAGEPPTWSDNASVKSPDNTMEISLE